MALNDGPTRLVWRDGQMIDWRDATIHVMSHVAHYGSCVFEGIRCYETPEGPAIFRLHDHMRRLLDSARIYRIPCRHTPESLCEAAIEVVAANGVRHCYLRPRDRTHRRADGDHGRRCVRGDLHRRLDLGHLPG
jgi:branched-chain amino acid aminotransferase